MVVEDLHRGKSNEFPPKVSIGSIQINKEREQQGTRNKGKNGDRIIREEGPLKHIGEIKGNKDRIKGDNLRKCVICVCVCLGQQWQIHTIDERKQDLE